MRKIHNSKWSTLQENITFFCLKVPIYVVWQHKTKISPEKLLRSSRNTTINYRNTDRKAKLLGVIKYKYNTENQHTSWCFEKYNTFYKLSRKHSNKMNKYK